MSFACNAPLGAPASRQLPAERVDCFSVFAAADPAVLPRLLGLVAMFGLVPERCHASRLDFEPGRPLVVDFQVAGLGDDKARLMQKKLERIVSVTQVLWSEKRREAA